LKDLRTYLVLRKLLKDFLLEDIGTGDITTNSIISPNIRAVARIICKADEKSVVCGLEEANAIFDICKCESEPLVKDGESISAGITVMVIYGKAHCILMAERTALNLLMRMSGIATATRYFLDILHKHEYSIRIACTRKTAPGLRFLDKRAVMIGGGDSHRMRLDDMILIKDNHLAVTKSIIRSIKLAKKNKGQSIRVECEVKNTDEAITAINAGADIIMLDNFSPQEAKKTIEEIVRLELRNKIEIEISGGITIDNILEYAEARPDIISIGHLTHSSKAIDFSLEIDSNSE
jgi:nicotinate-nucleotide pyrophosphorylase (carboxylating)